MIGLSSSFISLLNEEDFEFQSYAIDKLLEVVDVEWSQIASHVELISSFAKNFDFINHKKASLVTSIIYYHLGNMDEAVNYAVLAQNSFDPNSKNPYNNITSSHLIGICISLTKKESPIPTEMNNILRRILHFLHENGDYAACLCLAIETHFIEYIKSSIISLPALTSEAIKLTLKHVVSFNFRQNILKILGEFVIGNCNYLEISELYHTLNDPEAIAVLLKDLINSYELDNILISYQIAFDLAENAGQKFRAKIIDTLPEEMNILKEILTRKLPLKHQLHFQFDNTHPDLELVEALRSNLDTELSTMHSAVVYLWSLMFFSTGNDNFLRTNSQWFATSEKWSKFFTISSIGTVHMGHLDGALNVLGNYLDSNVKSEILGGSLYALGLIYANYIWDPKVLDTIRSSLSNSKQKYVQYGGCLALGLVALGSQNNDDYDRLKNIIMSDPTPESGEAAGYAIGMLMLGAGPSEEVSMLLNYALECPHEKILRGLSMGFALIVYGLQEEAEVIICSLLSSRKPVLREGGAWAISLAYVGTNSNNAIERLLHLAVSDVNGDVRRAAVIGVGFVLSKSPKNVPEMVGLLTKSYHPSVRSGSALAIGITCAGTGMLEAIELIKPLLEDKEKTVRQSAMIGMAMVLQLQSDYAVPYCKTFRSYLRKYLQKTTNDVISFGIGTAYGILYSGGRNSVISCNTLKGENSQISTVGLALFCNFFYFQPLAHMLSLSFHPTAIIGLNEHLEPVKDWKIKCKTSKLLYSDPPSYSSETPINKMKESVNLSITKKTDKKNEIPEEQIVIPEPDFNVEEVIELPSRITLNQLSKLDLSYSKDYEPITGQASLGFILLKNISK